jgi:hypothetical protein
LLLQIRDDFSFSKVSTRNANRLARLHLDIRGGVPVQCKTGYVSLKNAGKIFNQLVG